MNLAKTGQILCSVAFLDTIDRGLDRFSPIGKIRFKNVLREVEVFQLKNSDAVPVPLDPVCHMRINGPTKFIYHGSGTTFYFCSQHCMDIFESDIEVFMKQQGL
jgi:YHS domain-containing protein